MTVPDTYTRTYADAERDFVDDLDRAWVGRLSLSLAIMENLCCMSHARERALEQVNKWRAKMGLPPLEGPA